MRKFLKWFGITAGGLIGVFLVLLVVLFFVGSRKVNRTYDVAIASVAVPTDAASITRGETLPGIRLALPGLSWTEPGWSRCRYV